MIKNSILILDSVSHFCACALSDGKKILAQFSENIGKGHVEKLALQVKELCEENHVSLKDLEKILVNIGPGSFTGIRTSIAFARALALALKKSAFGISQLEAFAASHKITSHQSDNKILVLLRAYTDFYYVQYFDGNRQAINVPNLQKIENIFSIMKESPKYYTVISNDNQHLSKMAQEYNLSFFYQEHPLPLDLLRAFYYQKEHNIAYPLYILEPNAKIPEKINIMQQ